MRLNRDSVKLAAVVGATLLLVLVVVRMVGLAVDDRLLLVLPAITAVATYFGAVRTVVMPVREVVELLHRVGRREFDTVPQPSEGGGDMATLQRAVVDTSRALEKELGKLKRIETYRRDFLGNVSHELKTPIFAIHGFAETLLDGALEREDVRAEFVEKILRNADRLDNLASDLSEIAKIETGELKMKPRDFDLEDLVVEVLEALEPRAMPKEINLTYRVSPNLPFVFADDGRIRQVLLNLVDNGIKYTNSGGHVNVSARQLESGFVKVTVSDSGIGIAPEHIDRLTERFYRVDTSRSRAQGGTGLGLAIVKHILNAHGSQLLVESKPGYGSTFSFSLPASSVKTEADS